MMQQTVMVMAFDFGLKQIGVAVGQRMLSTAKPLGVLQAKEGKPQWSAIEALIQEWKPLKPISILS